VHPVSAVPLSVVIQTNTSDDTLVGWLADWQTFITASSRPSAPDSSSCGKQAHQISPGYTFRMHQTTSYCTCCVNPHQNQSVNHQLLPAPHSIYSQISVLYSWTVWVEITKFSTPIIDTELGLNRLHLQCS
jgi:hypothetical protein